MSTAHPDGPVRLRCEHRLGIPTIDTPRPRFSWELGAVAGNDGTPKATARLSIVIATSPALCTREGADVWVRQVTGEPGPREPAGGARSADATATYLDYNGPALESLRTYYWRVLATPLREETVRREERASEVAAFRTGYLRDEDVNAEWIRSAELTPFEQPELAFVGRQTEYEAVYYRRRFFLPAEAETVESADSAGPKDALLVVATTGVYRAWVNGFEVTNGYLEPAPVDFKRRAHYTVHAVGHLLNGPGSGGNPGERENEIVVAVGNGRSVEAYGYEPPMLLCELVNGRAESAPATSTYSRSRTIVASDAAWEACTGPITRNGIYCGCTEDARRLVAPTAGAGGAVELVEGIELTAQILEPVREVARLTPVSQWRVGPGRFIFDFGRVIAGVCSLTMSASEGRTVTLRHAELLTPQRELNTKTARAAEATDSYTAAGTGKETFTPSFTYHGFRYVEVTGFPGVPTADDLAAHELSTDLESVSKLAVDDDTVTAVHRNIISGQRANIVGLPTDCPQRDERQGWLGDYQLILEELCHNFHAATFLKKTFTDILDSRQSNGSIPDVVPAYWPLYPADPAWGSAFVQTAWYLYWFYGDARPARTHFNALLRYVDFLGAAASDGIVGELGKYGDWCPPGSIVPKNVGLEFTSTWYLYHDLRLLERLAVVVDRPEDASALGERAATVESAFNRTFLRDDAYRTGDDRGADSNLSQTAQALPLALDMVPAEHRGKVAATLIHLVEEKHDGHLDTGIIGTRYVFDVLSDLGRSDLALRVATTPSYPGYGYMLANGATSLWERWELLESGGMNSHNHIMLGSVDAWFFGRLAGLRCAAPGWSQIDIAPFLDGPLRYAAATVHTPRGRATVDWERSKDHVGVTLTVHVPPQSTGRLHVPPTFVTDTTDATTGAPIEVLEPGRHEIRLSRRDAGS